MKITESKRYTEDRQKEGMAMGRLFMSAVRIQMDKERNRVGFRNSKEVKS